MAKGTYKFMRRAKTMAMGLELLVFQLQQTGAEVAVDTGWRYWWAVDARGTILYPAGRPLGNTPQMLRITHGKRG